MTSVPGWPTCTRTSQGLPADGQPAGWALAVYFSVRAAGAAAAAPRGRRALAALAASRGEDRQQPLAALVTARWALGAVSAFGARHQALEDGGCQVGRVSWRGAHLPRQPRPALAWLSFRDVPDLLAERGLVVSHEAIRQWCATFGPAYAAGGRPRRA
jgi:hypothetical protein